MVYPSLNAVLLLMLYIQGSNAQVVASFVCHDSSLFCKSKNMSNFSMLHDQVVLCQMRSLCHIRCCRSTDLRQCSNDFRFCVIER